MKTEIKFENSNDVINCMTDVMQFEIKISDNKTETNLVCKIEIETQTCDLEIDVLKTLSECLLKYHKNFDIENEETFSMSTNSK